MSLKQEIEKSHKEIYGSRSKNRLSLQISYAIELIIEFYNLDFLILMDYIEDVSVIENPNNKQNESNKILNQYKKERAKAVEEYESMFYELSDVLDIPKEQIKENIEPGTQIRVSGAYGPRCKISQMLAFAKMQKLNQPNIISFPLVIDSPNSFEQDNFHIESILETLLNWNETSNQVIVSSIEGLEIAKKIDNIKIIELDNEKNHLLSNHLVLLQYSTNLEDIPTFYKFLCQSIYPMTIEILFTRFKRNIYIIKN